MHCTKGKEASLYTFSYQKENLEDLYVQEQVLEDERWQKILVTLANHPEKQGSDSDEVCSDDEGAWGRSMFRWSEAESLKGELAAHFLPV